MALYCLKCGRETGEKQVFCDSCLRTTKRYPVKPDAVVILPHRDTLPLRAGSRKRPPTLEERFAKLKLHNHWLTAAVVVLSIALFLATAHIIQQNDQLQFSQLVGRNYTFETIPD